MSSNSRAPATSESRGFESPGLDQLSPGHASRELLASNGNSHVNISATSSEAAQEQFERPDEYNMVLYLRREQLLPEGEFGTVLLLHDFFLRRSPFLAMIMTMFGTRVTLEILSGERFNCPHAFSLAIQVLYQYPLVDMNSIRRFTLEGFRDQETSDESFNVDVCMADFAICYATSGVFLDRRDITERGFNIATRLICMNNIEYILSFATNPQSFMLWTPHLLCTLPSYSPSVYPNYRTTHLAEFRDVWAKDLLEQALRFLAGRIPEDFTMHSGYFDSHSLRRAAYWRHNFPDIQFGEMPSLRQQRPDHDTTTISTILLNLPSESLRFLVGLMHARLDH